MRKFLIFIVGLTLSSCVFAGHRAAMTDTQTLMVNGHQIMIPKTGPNHFVSVKEQSQGKYSHVTVTVKNLKTGVSKTKSYTFKNKHPLQQSYHFSSYASDENINNNSMPHVAPDFAREQRHVERMLDREQMAMAAQIEHMNNQIEHIQDRLDQNYIVVDDNTPVTNNNYPTLHKPRPWWKVLLRHLSN